MSLAGQREGIEAGRSDILMGGAFVSIPTMFPIIRKSTPDGSDRPSSSGWRWIGAGLMDTLLFPFGQVAGCFNRRQAAA